MKKVRDARIKKLKKTVIRTGGCLLTSCMLTKKTSHPDNFFIISADFSIKPHILKDTSVI